MRIVLSKASETRRARARWGRWMWPVLPGVLLWIAGCSGLLPVRVEPRIVLVRVDHQLDHKDQGTGRITEVPDREVPTFTYADPVLRAELAIGSHQVQIELENRTDDDLLIDWDRSQLVDANDVGTRLFVRPGTPTALTPGDEKPRAILRNSKVRMRLSRYVGDAANIGATRPLFLINRNDEKHARADARAKIGSVVRLVMTFNQGDHRYTYQFHLRLADARINGKPLEGG